MTIIIPEGFAQATLFYRSGTFASGNAATVLAFGIGDKTVQELADSLSVNFKANLLPLMNSEITYVGLRAVTATDGADKTEATQGGRSGDCSPPQVTLLVKKTGTGRGPQVRGRNYWPGFLNDGDVDDSGNVVDSRLVALSSAFNAFGTAMSDDLFPGFILHNESDTDPTPINGGGVEKRVATQKRRIRKGR